MRRSSEDLFDSFTQFTDDVNFMHKTRSATELQQIQAQRVNLVTREVFIDGEIDETFGDWFLSVLRYLESKSNNPVVVWINTPGGDVYSMFAFHDAVRQSPCEVFTIGTGQICSAGVLMLASGHQRLVTESCLLMSHRSTDNVSGNLEQFKSYIKVVEWSERHWAKLMDRLTPAVVGGKERDEKYWFELGRKHSEWWVCGGEAIVAEGLADALYSPNLLPESCRVS